MNLDVAAYYKIGFLIVLVIVVSTRRAFYDEYVERKRKLSEPIPEGALRRTVTMPIRCKHCGRDL